MQAQYELSKVNSRGLSKIHRKPCDGWKSLLLTVFRNNAQTPGIVFELADMAGNHDGIGAVLRLTDESGRTQMREVQMGGGFMSFDAPRVHFGLGEPGRATRLAVRWADGTETVIEGQLETGNLYRISRVAGNG